jgi:glycosyltransferase involved in cell wall biosynthesis
MKTSNHKSAPIVAVDARALEKDFRAHFGRGTGRYVSEVLSRLTSLDYDDLKILKMDSSSLSLSTFQKKLSSILPAGKVTFESQFCMNKNISSLNANLSHFFFHGDAPAYPSTPTIISVLDLIPLKFPDLYQKGVGGIRYKFARFLERKAILSAKAIITISEASKKDIIEIMEIPEERIHVTYLGVDDSFFNLKNSNEINFLSSNLQILKTAFTSLYVGGVDARKNLYFLFNVISELNKIEYIKESGGFHLIIAGNYTNDKEYPKLKAYIDKSELNDFIHLSGFVDDDILKSLYKDCDFFIFPSLYEGFGLPVIEAMASGLPVIAGDNSCMSEVMGQSGWRLPDNDTRCWVSSINNLCATKLNNSSILKEQSELGIKQARKFNWDNTSSQTLEVYRKYLS